MSDDVVAMHASGGVGGGPAEDLSEGKARASADGGRVCPVCLGPVPGTRRSTAVYCGRRCYGLANQRRFRGQEPAGPNCKPWGRGGPGPAGAVRLTRADLVTWVTARGAATRQPAERVVELAVALYQATVASLQR